MLETNVTFRKTMTEIPSTTFGTFALYRYPAKFIPQVIAYVLKNYSTPDMTVFDPFAGYGTTGLVSRIYGNEYELWDLNPLLETFHSIATLSPDMIESLDMEKILGKMKRSRKSFSPRWSNINHWYDEKILDFLKRMWGYYHYSLDDSYEKLVLTIPLLKATRYFSFDDMQRQKLSTSDRSRKRVESLLSGDWEDSFQKMLVAETAKVIKGIINYSTLSPKPVKAHIKSGIDTMFTTLNERRDLLITSPPYLQSQEYMRQAKMDLFWLDYGEEFIKQLSGLEIPYRKLDPYPIQSETFNEYRYPFFSISFQLSKGSNL